MGRKARPWFRAGRGWFVTHMGKQIDLGVTDPNGQAAALAAFQQFLQAQQSGPTVAEAVKAYLERAARRVKPHTLGVYSWYLSQFALAFGDRPITGLTAEELEEDAKRPTWSSSTRHDYLGYAVSCLRLAGVTLRVQKPPKTSAGAKSYIPEDVFRRCLQWCYGDWHAVLTWLWHTGARPSEAAAVTVASVDWEARVVRLERHKTEYTGRDRLIYCNERALEVLSWQRDIYREGLLFRGRHGRPLNRRSFVRMFHKLSQKVGRRVNAYGLRHTYITRALAAGESDTIVAALAGHTSNAMIHRSYKHVSEMGRALGDAARRLGKAG